MSQGEFHVLSGVVQCSLYDFMFKSMSTEELVSLLKKHYEAILKVDGVREELMDGNLLVAIFCRDDALEIVQTELNEDYKIIDYLKEYIIEGSAFDMHTNTELNKDLLELLQKHDEEDGEMSDE